MTENSKDIAIMNSQLEKVCSLASSNSSLLDWFEKTASYLQKYATKEQISVFKALSDNYQTERIIWRYSYEYINKIYANMSKDFLMDVIHSLEISKYKKLKKKRY